MAIGSFYTGNAGNKNTLIVPFDNNPFITTSPYYGKGGKDWTIPRGINMANRSIPSGNIRLR